MQSENVSAIATPHGKGGIAIIRVSGKDPRSVAEKMFRPRGKTAVKEFQPYRMYPGDIDCGGFTDYGLCVYFKAPYSYTGEDVIEFHCHGGEGVAAGVLKKTFDLGAAPAGRGEFTRRAFLNGKLSLASAEGVADLINGESEAEIRAGYLLYNERLTDRVKALQGQLKSVLAAIGASVDYPEEDVEEESREQVKRTLCQVKNGVIALLSGYGAGRKIKSGVTVAICGKPNTGKSSLLNRLLGYDKAIVSSLAGTTRDAVEGEIEIEGVRFKLYDTAGVRESGDDIENAGIVKAENLIKSADLRVFVAEKGKPFTQEDARVLQLAKAGAYIKVLNKADLSSDETETDADAVVSAVTGEGIGELKRLIYDRGVGERSESSAFLVEERHYTALKRCKEALTSALNEIDFAPLDLLSVSVQSAWEILGEITGETASEEIVEEIFAKFCVGK
ncbi:MAG: tRNA uridine-5-carboxymethylaminomethyl(34) synthesis GTPase MnmE [Candidatus Borkfalkiaceae bacterium]|nr:tRNA uridine-5-carboxymethylaminomethyl(34) synthesis GTPase MnmE [Clostridia bacterium]MDY6223831.1 tRNA uridine-5-carboxymethylaminomethyl(34) synthesis GTPase MnmE [Christensenellaceae bacterium]